MSSPSIEELAAATPDTRDRSVDFIRAVSILTVVIGHWFIAMIWWQGGLIRTTSAVGVTAWLWLLTWLCQVMPLFFFVGGFSNLTAYRSYRRRGASTRTYIRSRVDRLLAPSLIFFAVWLPVVVVLHLTNTGKPAGPVLWGSTTLLRGLLPPGAFPFGPLWFLGAYLILVAISPVTVTLHERYRWRVVAVMAVGAALADYIGFVGGHPGFRWFNVIFVLMLPHQLGHFLGDGSFQQLSRKVFWAMVAFGLGGLVLLTNPIVFKLFGSVRYAWFPGIGNYPKSMLGTDIEQISNAYPPTICYLLTGIWTIGLVMLVRPALQRWLQRARPWRFTIGVNAIVMTLFLWHETAFLLSILLLWPLGVGHQHDTSAAWWIERIAWLGVPAVILMGLVGVFGRFERPRPKVGRAGGER
jgi:fucose 4-O-acetylase-like acetyltransferase